MSQHDLNIANQTFPSFRSDLNSALEALGTLSSGATAPSSPFSNQLWVDTAADPILLKIRNNDNDAWITIGSITATTDLFTLVADTISEATSAAGVTIDGVLLKDSAVSTDTISEKTGGSGVTVDGVLLKDSAVSTDTISEKTSAAGVTIDGVVLKDSGITVGAAINVADQLVNRPVLQDYAVEGSAIGNVGATRTFDLAVANFFSATVDQASTFTFSNPPASGDFGAFVMELTNGGAFTVTWPASVDWPGGTAPTLTASGKDQLVFTTRDGGTNWYGFVAGLDIKSP